MLDVTALSVRYGQHSALSGADIHVARGEIVVILGANGAGKSTLLKAISGIVEGTPEGAIRLDGQDLLGLPPHRIVEEGVALVPEGRGVFPDLSVRENLILGAYSARARADQDSNLARVHQLFPKLHERSRQIVRTMSGGEQQMVAIGRAMMSNPRILCLDEPSLGLSPLLCKELFANLRRVRDLGIGILLVEQNAKQSLAIADRGYLLENAQIVHEGLARDLRNDPAVQAAYLGAAGAAAPHTHDAPDAHPGTAPEVTPASAFEIRPRSTATRSADAVLGINIADLVARAGAQSQETARAGARSPAGPHPTANPQVRAQVQAQVQDRLKSTVDQIERAARAARRPALAPYAPQPAQRLVAEPAPTQRRQNADIAPTSQNDPVTIEIYRAPRVEIYRRRDGSDQFERSQGEA